MKETGMTADDRRERARKAGLARMASLTAEGRRSLASSGGKIGGKARARKLSAKRRREIAALGGRNSWKKVKGKEV